MSRPGETLDESLGVAVICDEGGHVVEALRDDLGLLAGNPQSLEEVIDALDRPRFERLLKEAAALRPAFDQLLDVGLGGRTERLHFGAASRDGWILVSAARSRNALMRLNLASAATPRQSPIRAPPTAVKDLAVYDDLSRLNNELATTERRLIKSNLALDRANRELRAFYESLPIGIFRADIAGRIEHANKQFCALTGVSSPAEWLGHVHSEDADGVDHRWRETILHGVAFDSVHRQLNEGHPPRHVEMKALVLRDEDAKAVGIVGLVEDISERARIAEQQREIERYNAVQQLIGGLAHNLNNIMMVMLSSAELLSEELPLKHALHSAARNNMAATERAALLTRRLMVYAGAGALFAGRIEVDPTIEAICHELRAGLGDRHELSMSLGAPGATIEISSKLLAEAIQEIVGNAKAALTQGGIIRLSTAFGPGNDTPDGRGVVIAVADEGVGMDDETLRHAKEPFFTTREVGQGLGLGLSLADGMARIADGVLAIRSQLGKGTTVELRLPAIEG